MFEHETRETGILCFRCKKRSGIDCPGRKQDEATLCNTCLKVQLEKDAVDQVKHLVNYLDGIRNNTSKGGYNVRDVWEALSVGEQYELRKEIGNKGVNDILSVEPSRNHPKN